MSARVSEKSESAGSFRSISSLVVTSLFKLAEVVLIMGACLCPSTLSAHFVIREFPVFRESTKIRLNRSYILS
jgi:hypothetical protein